MRRYAVAAILFLTFSLAAFAEVKLEGKTEIPRDSAFDLKLTGIPDKAIVLWDFLNDEEKLTVVNLKTRLICNGPPNSYRVKIRVISFDKDGNPSFEEIRAILVVKGKVDPAPDPDVDPDVDPDPKPKPSPIPAAGFRVLIIEETKDRPRLPIAQASIFTSVPLRNYLRSKCAVDRLAEQDGKAYRIWDKDTVADAPGLELWRDALKRPRTSVPWIIVSHHPHGGYEGPLPKDVPSTIELLKKYADLPARTRKGGK